jgi:aminobenzoyl-glutamate transport protein
METPGAGDVGQEDPVAEVVHLGVATPPVPGRSAGERFRPLVARPLCTAGACVRWRVCCARRAPAETGIIPAMSAPTASRRPFTQWIERVGHKIPDPVLLFAGMYVLTFLAATVLGDHTFSTPGQAGAMIVQSIKPVYEVEHVRWIFNNALVQNWLAFGGGVLGVILVVTIAIGVAEHAGLLGALIKKAARHVPMGWMPLLLVFMGIMSSLATDAGYLILVPLAGLLYAALKQNPLIGMAAAFAGVSAGFSANLIPATPPDVIVGLNARIFAEAQGVPFADASGRALNPATMNYFFMIASTFLLATVGAWVTRRFVAPRLAAQTFTVPPELDLGEFELSPAERRGLRFTIVGALVALLVIGAFAFGPLRPYNDAQGTRVLPFLNNIILMISLFFVIVGMTFGFASARFRRLSDVVAAMTKQMNTAGYILVLTFFSYNFLALLSYSGVGAYITYLGAQGLLALGVAEYPVLLLIGFVFTTACINLFVGGLTSKWLLLGPIFVPMLYQVNPQMTPDLVAAAYRVGDSSTNIVTPMMAYAGIVLAFMRRYRADLSLGDMMIMMVPYSIWFILSWSVLLTSFFLFGLPLGF